MPAFTSYRSRLAIVLVAVFTATPAALPAETLDEIVVVADFRERTAAELPPSISILEQERIEKTAVQHFEELIFSVPNLNWSGDGHRARYFQIRGVGELEQYEGAPNPSVGFLIDDIDFSGIATVATLFDIRQVEVLRGPQGSRYGANALAGLVYMQSVDPGTEWGGRWQLKAGGDDLRAAAVALGGPVAGEKLRVRLAASHHQGNGFRHNAYLDRDDSNNRRESMLRGKLLWQTDNDWFIKLTAMYSDIDDGYDAFAIDNSLTTLSDRPGQDAQESLGAALRAEWSGSSTVRLTSITTVADSDIDFSFDADWGNPEAWAPYTYDYISRSDRSRRTLSQELRLASADNGRLFGDRMAWLAGIYVMRLDDGLATLNQGDYVDPVLDFSLTTDDRFDSDFEATTAALFGEVEIDIGDAGSLTAGLRTERRSSDYRDSAGLRLSPSETMVGGELQYRHELNERVAAFVGLSRGYKAGGFNLGPVPAERREFQREALWNLEAGLRTNWLDARLHLDTALFLNRRRDQQVRTSFQLNPNDPASFVFFTDNAATGRSIGLESELRYSPDDAWEWFASIGLLKAEFDDFVTPQVNLSGRDQAHAPRYTIAAGGQWQHASGFFLRVDVSARDAFYFDVSHDQESSAYELVNARAGFETERYTVQLWARNLLDERYAVRGFYFGNEPPGFPDTLYVRQGDPRQAGITFDMRFEL